MNKVCNKCGLDKSLSSFRGGNNKCKACYSKEWKEKDPERARRINNKSAFSMRIRRPMAAILKDSRASDRRSGLGENDLDEDFIKELVANGCRYSGETQILISLDRIDNSIGHMKHNVNPCCLRCNYIRRNMPYEAWIRFSSTLKEVRAAGLFGTWQSVSLRKICSSSSM